MGSLLDVLKRLDPDNEEHWTADGFPKVDVVQELSGDNMVNRAQITEAAPLLSRETYKEVFKVVEDESETGKDQPDGRTTEEEKEEVDRETEIRARLPEIEKEMNDAAKAIDGMKTRIHELGIEHKALAQELEGIEKAAERPNTRIKEYIQSQNHLREQRHNAHSEVLKNLDPKSINPKSPLDAAMSRKNLRGAQRPKFAMGRK